MWALPKKFPQTRVAEIICDYQKSTQPWDVNEPVDLVLDVLPGCGGQGIKAEIAIADCAAYGAQ